jgi:rRNA maturation RNase YbeY
MDEMGREAEIYISLDRVTENSLLHRSSFEAELGRVMIHGILHLAGYADSNEEEINQMRQKEDEYLEKLSFDNPN